MPRPSDVLLVDRIRAGQAEAWADLIGMYEGRLLSFVASRLSDKSASEDVVQETLIGFLTSLPHYDVSQPLENYLFSIAAHKLTDHLRKSGRRPVLAAPNESAARLDDLPGSARPASSIARNVEQRQVDTRTLAAALQEIIDGWRKQEQWQRITVAELLFLRGRSNKEVAQQTKLTVQQVANHKFEFIARLRTLLKRPDLSDRLFSTEGARTS